MHLYNYLFMFTGKDSYYFLANRSIYIKLLQICTLTSSKHFSTMK